MCGMVLVLIALTTKMTRYVSMCPRGQLLVVCDLQLTCRGLADCCFILSVGIENFQTLVLGILHICHVGSIRSKEFRLVVEPGYLLGGAVLKSPAITHHPGENRVIYDNDNDNAMTHQSYKWWWQLIWRKEEFQSFLAYSRCWITTQPFTMLSIFCWLPRLWQT